MSHRIATALLATRWLLLPLYTGLLLAVLAIYAMVGRELLHLIPIVTSGTEADLILVVLSALDLVLVANLLVMVALSSYESYIARIRAADPAAAPTWLGKLDSSDVKLKVALSVVMISAIHLLRAFMEDTPPRTLILLGVIHLVFVLSAAALAWVDRTHASGH